jgi:hypothetical protein
MSATAWSTIASLATALGTLILAVATFSAVRSSNLMARVAQQQLLVQLKPPAPLTPIRTRARTLARTRATPGSPRPAGTGTSTGPTPDSPR